MVAKIHGVPYLVGLTIAGYRCGVEDGLYTLVPAQLEWIEFTARDNDPDFERCYPEKEDSGYDPLAFRFMPAEEEVMKTPFGSCIRK